jgi:hypothetical protein
MCSGLLDAALEWAGNGRFFRNNPRFFFMRSVVSVRFEGGDFWKYRFFAMRLFLMRKLSVIFCLGVLPVALAAPPSFVMPSAPQALLQEHCLDCHEEGTEKGDIRLDNLADLSLPARMDLMNRVLEQVYLKQMPPRHKSKLGEKDRDVLSDWVWRELHAHNASKLEEKMRYPSYGNYVDHDLLFSGQIKVAAFTPARRWLINPMIFDERVRDVFGLQGRDRMTPLVGVTNPFILPDNSGVRDYDIGLLDGGSLLVMLSNVEWISTKQIRAARIKAGEIGANDFPDPKDRWSPRTCPIEFEAVILKKSPPSDDELRAAIRKQFELVLRRAPMEIEASNYLELTRRAVELAGNSEGLRQMLKTVLLESEFLYRQEWGAGETDQHGRKMLAPREAAYAISYAMGDLGPDVALLAAASEGRLSTREDYRREVSRLLGDQQYYRGSVDHAFTTSKVTSHITSHPRIVRFFRDFFGYPNATKIFKDKERSGGFYQNPDRGTLATPGFLVDEADRIVDWHLQKDVNVFENLLSSDFYFVYHNRSNEEGAKIIREWKEFYEHVKKLDWRNKPEDVLTENVAFIAARPSLRGLEPKGPGQLKNYMLFFEEYFGNGMTPFTTIPWAHGYTFHHAPFYNLSPTPDIGRYGDWRTTKIKELPTQKFWDYPTQQPFRIAHRKGILSHPAWLIAHSQNTATDPVRRGRWVREKLLAGRVPDVPITVDAVIPEDHTKTLRSRLDGVTLKQECWKCHEFMNPLGLPFEIYDDFGRLRQAEPLEHVDNIIGQLDGRYPIYKTLPVDASGALDSTGDPKLDGDVKDALDMIDRLAKSSRARQSIIRHAFRFYMGRNEMLSDSQTLIDADNAYVKSGGSFRAVIISLLTSDSFLYRK